MTQQRLFRTLASGLLLAATVAIIILVVRMRRLGEARDELAWRVDTHCISLASDLRTAAKKYAQGAEFLRHPELTDGQRQRIDQAYFVSGVTGDITTSGRFAAGMALSTRFYFCLRIRDGEDKKLNELDNRFERARNEFTESVDHADIAQAVAEMADVAAIARDLPLRERRTPSPLD